MRNKKKCFLGMLVLVLLFVSRLAFALDFVYLAKLERIIDGDTIVADLYLGLNVILDDQYIRFYEIDAWEAREEEREKGLKAKEYLEERLSKRQIEIEIRPEWGQNGKGKYGRWFGVIYVDGVNVNAELVEKEHAEKYEEGDT